MVRRRSPFEAIEWRFVMHVAFWEVPLLLPSFSLQRRQEQCLTTGGGRMMLSYSANGALHIREDKRERKKKGKRGSLVRQVM